MPQPIPPHSDRSRTLFSGQLLTGSFLNRKSDRRRQILGLLLSLFWLPGYVVAAQATAPPPITQLAQASSNAPPELQNLITRLDTAASQRDLGAVLKFYSPDFKTSDGLNRQTLEQALKKFWQDFSSLTYRTTINNWQATSDGFIAETTTTISGAQTGKDRQFALKATLKSKQRFVGNTIVSQEILQEGSQLTSGSTPPTIDLSMPTQVRVGQEYNLDAIVREPLGDSLLVGTATETAITPESYLKSPPPDLELLSAGGIYKIGKAPNQPGDRWVSIALIWDSGMTLITQRLKVVQ